MRVVGDQIVLKNGEVAIHESAGNYVLLGDGISKAHELVKAIQEFHKSIYAPKKTTRKKVVKDAE